MSTTNCIGYCDLEVKASVDGIIFVYNARRNELDYFDNHVFGHACETILIWTA